MKCHSIFCLFTVVFLFPCNALLGSGSLIYLPSKNDSLPYLNIFKITPGKVQGVAGHFAFEVYAGLGVRYRDVKHIYHNPHIETAHIHRHGPDRYNNKGSYFTLSLPVNFRIGWAF